jgi:putative transposase
MQLIKGESSHWINQSKIFRGRFEWCSKYYAASVCEERINIVRKYIASQEKHNRLKSFTEECKELFPFSE